MFVRSASHLGSWSFSFCHLWTGVPVEDRWNTVRCSSVFLGFASETAFLVSPHQFFYFIKVQGLVWWLHDINPVGLEPGCCRLLVRLRLSSCFSSSGFKYFDVFKLIHDPWYVINNISIPWCLLHRASVSSVFCSFNSVFGGRLINCLWTQEEQSSFHQSTKCRSISL